MALPKTDTAQVLQSRLHTRPAVAVIAGSGIMQAFRDVTVTAVHAMADLPGVVVPAVEGHGTALIECRLANTDVLLITGRLHLYEGYHTHDVVRMVDVCHQLGINHLVLTNATGGVHPLCSPGDVMIPDDVLDLTFSPTGFDRPTRPAPDPDWVRATISDCNNLGLRVLQGTYAQVLGPSYETRAEIGMLRRLGVDAVGMSTSVEATYAASLGMRTFVCSMITNTVTDTAVKHVTHEEVLSTAANAVDTVARVCTVAVGACATLFLKP